VDAVGGVVLVAHRLVDRRVDRVGREVERQRDGGLAVGGAAAAAAAGGHGEREEGEQGDAGARHGR
jgi:hypothetical protein